VRLDLLVPLVRISRSPRTCPRLGNLNQPGQNIPKDKHLSLHRGASYPQQRSNANMTSNCRPYEIKVLRRIRCVGEMTEVGALILVAFSRSPVPILEEEEFSFIPIDFWPHRCSKSGIGSVLNFLVPGDGVVNAETSPSASPPDASPHDYAVYPHR